MTVNVLKALLEEKRLRSIHDVLSMYNPVDLAELLSELDYRELAMVFRILDKPKAAETFSYMDNDLRQELIKTFSSAEVKSLFEELFADDAADFLSDMPANFVTQLLENVDAETRKTINYLLQYPDDSVGSIMTVEFVELDPDMTVDSALEKIRRVGIDSETVYNCYAVKRHKLLGVVTAKDLLTHGREEPIAPLILGDYISIHTTDDREDAAKLFRKYGLISIPVVDTEGCIVGIVTFDDAIGVLTEETTEDMQKMAAMEANTEPYLKTPAWKHAKHRIVWLLVLMLSASITGAIISKYEAAFAAVPLLVSFIPMIMDTGGNCGSQSSTLIIRGLAVDELRFADTARIIWMELRVALLVGLGLAVADSAFIMLRYNDLRLAGVVSAAMLCTVVCAKVTGGLLPIAAKRLGMDPALMAAPLITTVVDTVAMFIYFTIASAVFAI